MSISPILLVLPPFSPLSPILFILPLFSSLPPILLVIPHSPRSPPSSSFSPHYPRFPPFSSLSPYSPRYPPPLPHHSPRYPPIPRFLVIYRHWYGGTGRAWDNEENVLKLISDLEGVKKCDFLITVDHGLQGVKKCHFVITWLKYDPLIDHVILLILESSQKKYVTVTLIAPPLSQIIVYGLMVFVLMKNLRNKI